MLVSMDTDYLDTQYCQEVHTYKHKCFWITTPKVQSLTTKVAVYIYICTLPSPQNININRIGLCAGTHVRICLLYQKRKINHVNVHLREKQAHSVVFIWDLKLCLFLKCIYMYRCTSDVVSLTSVFSTFLCQVAKHFTHGHLRLRIKFYWESIIFFQGSIQRNIFELMHLVHDMNRNWCTCSCMGIDYKWYYNYFLSYSL